MQLQENTSLQHLNTFGISASATYLQEINTKTDLTEALSWASENKQEIHIIGGGSNILLTQNPKGLILLNRLTGINVEQENDKHVWVKAAAGENWHNFVQHCINQGWGGLENLSLIPGCVGAAPMQNIGAYGVEIKDHMTRLEAWTMKDGTLETFTNEQCAFGYRESVFKRALKGKHLIASVTFKLTKQNHQLRYDYGAIKDQLASDGITQEPSIKQIADAVIAIRQSKLPNPAELGNAGSFFKNPVVSAASAKSLLEKFNNMPQYPAGNGLVKLAAGWLIEQCGLKGQTFGKVGVHKKQALVLVNYGGGTGKEVYDLSSKIVATVKEKFGVELEREVNIW